MLDGWSPSLIFRSMAENATTGYDKEYFFKALSVAQFRPTITPEGNPKEQHGWPLIQLFQYSEAGENFGFCRLHPQLRRPDARLQLDGSIVRAAPEKPNWKRTP